MFKYFLQEMNDVRNTGKRAVYPKMVINQTLGTEEFIDVLHDSLRTTASKEFAKITADSTMPIDYTGQASYKIWIRCKG